MPTNCPPRPTTEPNADAIIDRLRSVEIFAELDENELELIAAASEPVRIAAGGTLVKERTSGDGVFVVVSGRVEVLRICERVAIVTEGGVVGELAALGYGRRSATLLAGTDVEALHVSGPAFTSLLDAFPDADRRLQPLVAARTRRP